MLTMFVKHLTIIVKHWLTIFINKGIKYDLGLGNLVGLFLFWVYK